MSRTTARKSITELQAELDEDEVNDLARFNPPHALQGWAAGFRANGDELEARKHEAALERQDAWKLMDAEVVSEMFGRRRP